MTDATRVIFRTVHGSRLYGLDHAGSDRDEFVVTDSDSPKARHTIAGGLDTVTVGFDRFLENARHGSPQSVEALFSPMKQWNPRYECLRPLLAQTRICGPEVFARYECTVTAFAFGDYKQRRHACRLAMNLARLRECGRFDPRLSSAQIARAAALAHACSGRELLARLLP